MRIHNATWRRTSMNQFNELFIDSVVQSSTSNRRQLRRYCIVRYVSAYSGIWWFSCWDDTAQSHMCGKKFACQNMSRTRLCLQHPVCINWKPEYSRSDFRPFNAHCLVYLTIAVVNVQGDTEGMQSRRGTNITYWIVTATQLFQLDIADIQVSAGRL